MTDQRLRDLERDAAHGDLQAQARLLQERVRVGDLSEERLALAAHLGDSAAIQATGAQVPKTLADWLRGLDAFGREVLHRAASVIGAQPGLCEVRPGRGLPGTAAFSRAVLRALDLDSCDRKGVIDRVREQLLPWALGLGDAMQRRNMLQLGPRSFPVAEAKLVGQVIDRRKPDVSLELDVRAAACTFDGERFEPRVNVDLTELGLEGWAGLDREVWSWSEGMISIHVLDHTETYACTLRFLARPDGGYDMRWEGLCGVHWDRRWTFRPHVPLLVEAQVSLDEVRINASTRSKANRLLAEHAGRSWRLAREQHGWFFYARSAE